MGITHFERVEKPKDQGASPLEKEEREEEERGFIMEILTNSKGSPFENVKIGFIFEVLKNFKGPLLDKNGKIIEGVKEMFVEEIDKLTSEKDN